MISPGTELDSAENRRAGILTTVLLVSAVCLLAFVKDPWALDSGKVPRLLVLNVILAGLFAMVALPAWRKCLDWSGAGHRICLAFAAYAFAVWFSLLHAANVSAGLIDAARTSATLLVLVFAASCFRSFAGWKESLAKVGSGAALCSGSLGAYKIATLPAGDFPSRHAMEGITGLMGNVNFYAGYLMLLLPLCILGVLILRGWWRGLAMTAAIFASCLVVLLQTRSVWLGTAVGMAVFAVAAVARPAVFGGGVGLRRGVVAGAAVVLLGVGAFFHFAPADNPFVMRIGAVFSDDLAVSDGGRVMIWRETFQMGVRHFPFGVGAGNFPVQLHSVTSGGAVDFSKIDREWNQPHNDFLWVFAEKGVLGLLAFLAIFIFGFAAGWRIFRHAASPPAALSACAATAGLAAYVVDSFFSFPLDRVNHQVLLAILLAMLVADDRRPANREMRSQFPGRRGLVSTLVVVLLLASGLLISIASIRQEWHVAAAREAMRRMDWETMQARARMAATPLRTLDTYSVPVSFLEGFAWMKIGFDEKAIVCFRKARSENPYKLYILNNLGILFSDRGDYDEAIALFIQAINLYPERTEALHNLAVTLFDQERFEESADVLLELPVERRDANILSMLAKAIRERNKERLFLPVPEDGEEEEILWETEVGDFSW